MTQPWTVNPNDPFTVPNTAGPGQARIVIGTVLPPALAAYTFTETFNGGTFQYGGAIIFYPNSTAPVDTNYTYVATTKQTAGADTLVWHVGTVVNNAVVESAPGFPEVLQFSESIIGATADGRILQGGRLLIQAMVAALEMSAATDVNITAANTMNLVATATDVNVTAAINAVITAAAVTLIGGSSSIQISNTGINITTSGAGDPINLDAQGDIQVQGVKAFLVTLQQTNAATGAATVLAVAAQNIPGCLISPTTVTTNARYHCEITCDFQETVIGVSTGIGELVVDGVVQTQQALYAMAAVGDRATVTQTFSGALAAPGVHTFQLQARKSAAAGTQLCNNIHTTISLTILESGG